MADDLTPITDEQAKVACEALEVLKGFGGFLRQSRLSRRVFSTVGSGG